MEFEGKTVWVLVQAGGIGKDVAEAFGREEPRWQYRRAVRRDSERCFCNRWRGNRRSMRCLRPPVGSHGFCGSGGEIGEGRHSREQRGNFTECSDSYHAPRGLGPDDERQFARGVPPDAMRVAGNV